MHRVVIAGTAAILLLSTPVLAQAAPDKASPQVARLLKLMDKDKNGNVSRQEFLDFMAAEFDRLDKDHNGTLNVAELNGLKFQSQVHPGGSGK
jgi:Ca2+-binding EF-hand superfamily protein